MGDEVQAIKAGPARGRRHRRRQQGRPARRAADGGPAAGDAGADASARQGRRPRRGPRPKRPEVLVTTALTGEGVPGAAGRARAAPRRRRRRRVVAARRARATAQVRAVLAERLWDRLDDGRSGDGDRGAIADGGRPRARPVRRGRPAARGLARTAMTSRRAPRPRPSSPGRSSCSRRRARVLHGGRHGAPGVVAVRRRGPRRRRGRRRRGRRGVRARRAGLRPVVGWASDRFGRRPLLVGGALLTVVALLLHLAASTLPAFVAVRAAFGVAEAFFFVALLAAASDLAPPDRRGEALNLAVAGAVPGARVRAAAGRDGLGAAGYTAVWIAAAALAGVAAVLALSSPRPRRPCTGDRRARRGRRCSTGGRVPGRRSSCGLRDGRVPRVRAAVRAPGRPRRGGAAAGGLRADRGRAPARRSPAARPGRARRSCRRRARRRRRPACCSTVSFASPIGLVVGTAVFAAGVAFVFPALLSLAVSRVAETERGVAVGHDQRVPRRVVRRRARRVRRVAGPGATAARSCSGGRRGARRRCSWRSRRASLVAADRGGVRSGDERWSGCSWRAPVSWAPGSPRSTRRWASGWRCTSRTSRAPTRAVTGSRPTSSGRSRRAGSRRRIAKRRSPASCRRTTRRGGGRRPRRRGGVRGRRRQVARCGPISTGSPRRTRSSRRTRPRSRSTALPRRWCERARPGSSACTSSAPCR